MSSNRGVQINFVPHSSCSKERCLERGMKRLLYLQNTMYILQERSVSMERKEGTQLTSLDTACGSGAKFRAPPKGYDE